ncbi:hypothetical protein JGU66_13670 [Myxococcaceae bacterium JPH2]|nr:hypothetical protein [Myxococcaceae bacterium JPH2]
MKLGSELLLADGNFTKDSPTVASDGADYLVAWVDLRSVGRIKGARVSGATDTVLATGLDLSRSTFHTNYPAVTYGGGVYLLAWTGYPTSTDGNVYAVRVSPADGALLDAENIPLCTLSGHQDMPRVAFDGGNFLVDWRTSQNLFGTRVSPAGRVVDGAGFVIMDQSTPAPPGLPRPGPLHGAGLPL